MKIIILLLLVSCSNVLKGQFPLSDTVYQEINKLRATNNDTIIRLELPPFQDMVIDTLPGLGIVYEYGLDYLIIKKSEKIYSLKYVYYCNEDCSKSKVSVSEPLIIASDSLFTLIRHSIGHIKNEEIYPYIYQVRNDNYSYYNTMISSHPTSYYVGIYVKESDIIKLITMNSLVQFHNGFPENLNYKANVATALNTFFRLLSNCVDSIDKLYVFKP